MPPKRSSNRPKTSNQSTLAFHGTQSRITKPSVQAISKSKFLDSSTSTSDSKLKRLSSESAASVKSIVSAGSHSDAEDIPQRPEDDALPPTTAERAIEQQVKKVQEQVKRTEEEEAALKIKDAEIKKYWKAKENARSAPRVHQSDLSLEEKILREWDTSAQYGPSIGIARLKRWNRAHRLNLEPPIEVLAVLLKQENVSQRAHVDELMSSRFIET